MKTTTIRLLSTLQLLLQSSSVGVTAFTFSSSQSHQLTTATVVVPRIHSLHLHSSTTNNNDNNNSNSDAPITKAPTLNGKMVLPLKPMKTGLQHHKVAAVYALLNSQYTRSSGTEGWEHVTSIGITKDLYSVLNNEELMTEKDVKFVRALSFTYPQKGAMEDFAGGWRLKVQEAQMRMMIPADDDESVDSNKDSDDDVASGTTLVGGGEIATISHTESSSSSTIITVGDDYEFDEDDEDMDEDDLDDYLQMMAESRAATSTSSATASAPLFVDTTSSSSIDAATQKEEENNDAIISPFENDDTTTTTTTSTVEEQQQLQLTQQNVDKVLDEVRPYLISDGGNVSVHNVDTTTGNVYLKLEGACGSCASSTVTMQMGIERVLKEKFEDRLGEVIQVEDDDENNGEGNPTELTMEAVQTEVKRMSQAITAMGGVVRVLSVDPIGVVEIEFRGPNRVKKGLELALLDLEFVKHVKFVS